MKIKLYSVNHVPEIIERMSDVGIAGEPIYNPRDWSPIRPEIPAGKFPRIKDVATGEWEYLDDMRGKWFLKEDGQVLDNSEIPFRDEAEREYGISFEDFTKIAPAENLMFPKWSGSKWVNDASKQAAYDDMIATVEADRLIGERMQKNTRDQLIAEGVLDANGKVKK